MKDSKDSEKRHMIFPIKKLLIAMIFIVIGNLMTNLSIAQTKMSGDFDRLYQILAISDQDTNQSYIELQQFKKQLFSKPHDPQVELAFYKIAIAIYSKSNHDKEVDQSIENLAKFSKEIGDIDHQLIAQLMRLNFGINTRDTLRAVKQLSSIEPEVNISKNKELHYLFHLKRAIARQVLGQFDLAIEDYLKVLKNSDYDPVRKDHVRVYTLISISSFYISQKIPSKALELNLEAQAIAKKIKLNKYWLANLKMLEGSALLDLGKKTESLDAYKEAIELSKEAKSLEMELISLINISDYYLRDKKYNQTKAYALQSLEIAKKIKDVGNEAVSKINLGLAFAYLGDVKKGVSLIQQGIDYQKSIGSKVEEEATLKDLAEMYENIGMIKEALKTIKEQQNLSNQLYTNTRAKAIADMQEQFDVEQKSIKIDLLEKENALQNTKIQNHSLQTTVLVLASILFVGFGASILMLYFRIKKSNLRLKNANTQLEFHAIHDPLTGLFNRRSFVNLMKNRETSFQNERRNVDDIPDCLILMDLDFFKSVNDRFGHAAGDEVLKVVANRLLSVVRETDMVLRWGGEEFLIYSRKSHIHQAALLVERILKIIGENEIEFEGKKIKITATCGFVSLPFIEGANEFRGWEKTLQIADAALYFGKNNGRNRAYGIGKILVDEEIAMPIIVENLPEAIEKELVEVIEINGAKN